MRSTHICSTRPPDSNGNLMQRHPPRHTRNNVYPGVWAPRIPASRHVVLTISEAILIHVNTNKENCKLKCGSFRRDVPSLVLQGGLSSLARDPAPLAGTSLSRFLRLLLANSNVLHFQDDIPAPLDRLIKLSGFTEAIWNRDFLKRSVSWSHGKWYHLYSTQRKWMKLLTATGEWPGVGGSGHPEPASCLPQLWAYVSPSLPHG